MFHELAHHVVYMKGDTTFNESFAVAVEEEGLRRWLAQNATPAEREAYAASRERRGEFVRLVLRYRERLAAFYREPLADDAKRAGKRALFAELTAEYGTLKTETVGRLRRLRPVLRRHEQRPPRLGRDLRGSWCRRFARCSRAKAATCRGSTRR